MNLILFNESELRAGVPLTDARARHILEVLRLSTGQPFDVGIINGPRGKARIRSMADSHLTFDFDLGVWPPDLHPITLLVGLSRPQTMRRILRDGTSLGVARLHFFASEKGEKAYGESSLWKSGEYRRHLVEGAQQAFTTHLPEVRLFPSLETCLDADGSRTPLRAALDNYESPCSLGAFLRSSRGVPARAEGQRAPSTIAIAVGSERGWSAAERDFLRSNAFSLVHLGQRVLRTEVACIGAVSIILSELRFYDSGDESA